MRVIIAGIPGTGKTSVAKGLVLNGWTLVGFGTVMFEIAKKKYGTKARDDMRTEIPVKEYRKLQEEAAKKIGKMEGKIIIDTHCSVLSKKGYYPGLPWEVLEKLKPHAIISIEADPKEIKKRRKKDEDIRVRVGDPKEHQEINRYFAAAYSAMSRAPVSFIQNKQGKLSETVDMVLKTLEAVEADE